MILHFEARTLRKRFPYCRFLRNLASSWGHPTQTGRVAKQNRKHPNIKAKHYNHIKKNFFEIKFSYQEKFNPSKLTFIKRSSHMEATTTIEFRRWASIEGNLPQGGWRVKYLLDVNKFIEFFKPKSLHHYYFFASLFWPVAHRHQQACRM